MSEEEITELVDPSDQPREKLQALLALAVKTNHLAEPSVANCSLESLYLWRKKGSEWFLDSTDLCQETQDRFCPICSKPVKGKMNFCSKPCKVESWRREHPERFRLCPICHKDFWALTKSSKFCSRECFLRKGELKNETL